MHTYTFEHIAWGVEIQIYTTDINTAKAKAGSAYYLKAIDGNHPAKTCCVCSKLVKNPRMHHMCPTCFNQHRG